LIPLVIATGAGAIGNRTIGTSSLGGMLLGTIFGVIVVPGLYLIFGTIAHGKKLISDEDENPLSEVLVEEASKASMVKRFLKKIRIDNGTKNNN
jgi:hydrophobic/amphiphilic exporter-1 (mainly G- bacteria), HAE1 family